MQSYSPFEKLEPAIYFQLPCSQKTNLSFVADNTDMFWDSICLGDMWTKLGLVQSLILSPVGPVDPVEKTRIELEYVNSEVSVRFMRSRIFFRN